MLSFEAVECISKTEKSKRSLGSDTKTKFLMRNKLSSLRNNNGMRNEEGEIKSAVRTNLISTRSFSFD